MPRFAANLTMLFTEVPFLDRFEKRRARRLRARSSSCSRTPARPSWSPRLQSNGLKLVLHNLPAGDWEAGERGIACLPDRVDEFREGVAQGDRVRHGARRAAAQLPGRQGAARRDRRDAAQDLRREPAYAAAELKKAGLKLLIEPINTFDIPGFYLNRTAQATGDHRRGRRGQPLPAVRHLPRAAHGRRARPRRCAKHLARIAPHAARRQPGPQRARHRRDQLPVPVRAPRRSATPAGSAASTSPPPTTEAGLGWLPEH